MQDVIDQGKWRRRKRTELATNTASSLSDLQGSIQAFHHNYSQMGLSEHVAVADLSASLVGVLHQRMLIKSLTELGAKSDAQLLTLRQRVGGVESETHYEGYYRHKSRRLFAEVMGGVVVIPARGLLVEIRNDESHELRGILDELGKALNRRSELSKHVYEIDSYVVENIWGPISATSRAWEQLVRCAGHYPYHSHVKTLADLQRAFTKIVAPLAAAATLSKGDFQRLFGYVAKYEEPFLGGDAKSTDQERMSSDSLIIGYGKNDWHIKVDLDQGRRVKVIGDAQTKVEREAGGICTGFLNLPVHDGNNAQVVRDVYKAMLTPADRGSPSISSLRIISFFAGRVAAHTLIDEVPPTVDRGKFLDLRLPVRTMDR